MSQTGDELKTALKLAAKADPGKALFFAMVVKGGAEGQLFVDKRKIASAWTDVAKKQFNTSTVIRGKCFGIEDMIMFETPVPPAGNLGAIAKRLTQLSCGLTIKPEFRQGGVDEGDDADAPSASVPVGPASPQAKASAPPEAASSQAKPAAHPDAASPQAMAKKAYESLLGRVQPQVREARDGQSPALPKIASLLEFAVGKAATGDHAAAVKALQKLEETVTEAAEAQVEAFNLRFAALAAAIKQATEDKVPAAAAARSKAVEAVAAAKKDYREATVLVAEAEQLLKAAPKSKSTVARERAPIAPTDARVFLAQVDSSEDEDSVRTATASLLDDMKTALVTANKLITLPNMDALAQAMATDKGISQSQAQQMIDNNKGRGFTAGDGTVYVLGGTPQAAHDEVHETVHLMSAAGGATQIMAKYGEQLNEACTEYFTKEMCAKLKVPDAEAYPAHVAFMNKLVPVVGYGLVYTAYMKNGGFDPVVNKLVDIWIAKADTLPGPQKPPNKGGVTLPRDKVFEAMDKRFLNNFPPEGAAMGFWNKVFFA